MAPKKNTDKSHRPQFLFKVTVVGPEDKLLEEVLCAFDETVIAIDGIRIGSTEIEVDDTDVETVLMSPKHSALDLLLSLSFTGAKAAIIVVRDHDPEIETVYRNKIREQIGGDIPCRVVEIGREVDDQKKAELTQTLEDLIEELLSRRS